MTITQIQQANNTTSRITQIKGKSQKTNTKKKNVRKIQTEKKKKKFKKTRQHTKKKCTVKATIWTQVFKKFSYDTLLLFDSVCKQKLWCITCYHCTCCIH